MEEYSLKYDRTINNSTANKKQETGKERNRRLTTHIKDDVGLDGAFNTGNQLCAILGVVLYFLVTVFRAIIILVAKGCPRFPNYHRSSSVNAVAFTHEVTIEIFHGAVKRLLALASCQI